jgi:hypothetical protein
VPIIPVSGCAKRWVSARESSWTTQPQDKIQGVGRRPAVRTAMANAKEPGWMPTVRKARLLFEDEGWAANLFGFKGYGDFDVVGDLDEGDAAVHAIVFAIEDHFAINVFKAVVFGRQS